MNVKRSDGTMRHHAKASDATSSDRLALLAQYRVGAARPPPNLVLYRGRQTRGVTHIFLKRPATHAC